MFSSSMKNQKILNAEVGGCYFFSAGPLAAETASSFSGHGAAAPPFSSLLVGVRADFTPIRVVRDKTGCHRCACSVSWAWFLLWAGSTARHFYSDPRETLPCGIILGCEITPRRRKAASVPWRGSGEGQNFRLDRADRSRRFRSQPFTSQQQGLAECNREDIRAGRTSLLLCGCVTTMGGAFPPNVTTHW